MAVTVTAECFGCGACEASCPHRAISQAPSFPVTYVVDPLGCNDCGACVPLCPVEAIVDDGAWAVCHGRGCPLTSHRYAEVTCTEGDPDVACPTCGGPRWTRAGAAWWCPTCDRPGGAAGARCPKARRAAILASRGA